VTGVADEAAFAVDQTIESSGLGLHVMALSFAPGSSS
jgi:hypothetical protein